MILLFSLCLNLDSLLAETQGNELMWSDYMQTHQGEVLECCSYLLENIPRLDRLEMTEEILDDHILNALPFRNGLPDSIFFSGLLWYRTAVEPVAPFRATLSDFWAEQSVTVPEDVVSWTESNLTILTGRYLGGMESPLQVLSSGSGTRGEIRVLQAASIRSLGYPVRTVYGWFRGEDGGERSWLEIWEDGGWMPLSRDFTDLVLAVEKSQGENLTAHCTDTFVLVIIPPDESAGEFMVSLNVPVKGKYLPLDWVFESDTLQLGNGELLVSLTRRLPSGAVEVWNTFISGSPGDTLHWRAADCL